MSDLLTAAGNVSRTLKLTGKDRKYPYLTPKDAMVKEVEIFSLLNGLVNHAQFIDVSQIAEKAVGETGDYVDAMYPDLFVPPAQTARNPAEITFLYWEFTTQGHRALSTYILVNESGSGKFHVIAAFMDTMPVYLGCINTDDGYFTFFDVNEFYNHLCKNDLTIDDITKTSVDNFQWSLRRVASILMVLNTPSFVRSIPCGSRQARRQLARTKGIAQTRWSKITWQIDQRTAVNENENTSNIQQALHFRRGHWRKAESHHMRSVLLDGEFKTWIDGYWAGHPAFGFVKQIRQPTM